MITKLLSVNLKTPRGSVELLQTCQSWIPWTPSRTTWFSPRVLEPPQGSIEPFRNAATSTKSHVRATRATRASPIAPRNSWNHSVYLLMPCLKPGVLSSCPPTNSANWCQNNNVNPPQLRAGSLRPLPLTLQVLLADVLCSHLLDCFKHHTMNCT